MVCISLVLKNLAGNDQTDDESCTSNCDGPPASDPEEVQNAVVKLEEVDWEENYLQETAQSPSTDDLPVSDLVDVQNVVVKLEEVICRLG